MIRGEEYDTNPIPCLILGNFNSNLDHLESQSLKVV